MDAIRRAHFQSLLIAERDRIQSALGRVAAAGYSQLDDVLPSPGEEAVVGGLGVGPYDDDALAAREGAALAEVEQALNQLTTQPDRFGTCTRCGENIREARLELLPATRFCHKHAA